MKNLPRNILVALAPLALAACGPKAPEQAEAAGPSPEAVAAAAGKEADTGTPDTGAGKTAAPLPPGQ